MSYLFFQTWILLLLAFLLGIGLGWVLRNISAANESKLKDK